MRVALFYHSLLSDWNHGNAHFLRGVVGELQSRGHDVLVFEPQDNWSLTNLLDDHGEQAVAGFHQAYPDLDSRFYAPERIDLEAELDGVDLVLVHEWNDHDLVADIGRWRTRHPQARVIFHDTHHRSVSQPEQMEDYDLSNYDGVLAFGEVISEIYRERGWAERVWTWHEAADTRLFRPIIDEPDLGADAERGDLIWIGNWGDDERSEELQEFLLDPVEALGLDAVIHGVRYPDHALEALEVAGVDYRGWIANYRVARAFARYRMTVHVPRRFYVEELPGIPTIRVFEALACGIPLICSPWEDAEGLFRPGQDYLVADDGDQMRAQMRAVLQDDAMARELVQNGRDRILDRHTCAHRVNELMAVCAELGICVASRERPSATHATQSV